MHQNADRLPEDVDALKGLLIEQRLRNDTLSQHNATLQADREAAIHTNEALKAQVDRLQEQLNLALARRYAARSEKYSPDQIRLFDEAEVDVEVDDAAQDTAQAGTVTVATHTRRKRGRRALPEALPRIEVVRRNRSRICGCSVAVRRIEG